LNKRWRNIGLYVLIVVVVIFVGSAFFDKPSPTRASRTLRYSDFIEAVQEKQVSRVLISPDKGTAQIVESDGNRALVNLAPDQELLKLLDSNQVKKRLDILIEAIKGNGTDLKFLNRWGYNNEQIKAISESIYKVAT